MQVRNDTEESNEKFEPPTKKSTALTRSQRADMKRKAAYDWLNNFE